jgi:hypothetical protein
MNDRKQAKRGDRQRDMAKKPYQDGLLNREGFQKLGRAAGKMKGPAGKTN